MSRIGPAHTGSMLESSARVSRYPEMTVSGVRSSCDAFATKSLRVASKRACRVTSRTNSRDCPSPYGTTCNARYESIWTGGLITSGIAKSSPCR